MHNLMTAAAKMLLHILFEIPCTSSLRFGINGLEACQTSALRVHHVDQDNGWRSQAHHRSCEACAAMARHAVRGSRATQQAAALLSLASRVHSADNATSQGPMKVRTHPAVSCTYEQQSTKVCAPRCTCTRSAAECPQGHADETCLLFSEKMKRRRRVMSPNEKWMSPKLVHIFSNHLSNYGNWTGCTRKQLRPFHHKPSDLI